MTSSDILRSLRYLLETNTPKLVEICQLGGLKVSQNDLQNYLKTEEEKDFQECPDLVVAHFLDGLIVLKRGKDESRPPAPIELPVTNNLVLKKLKIAFQLQEQDLMDILKSVQVNLSKSELSALFRSRDHRNFRLCGDQFLRKFLKGLTERLRSSKS